MLSTAAAEGGTSATSSPEWLETEWLEAEWLGMEWLETEWLVVGENTPDGEMFSTAIGSQS